MIFIILKFIFFAIAVFLFYFATGKLSVLFYIPLFLALYGSIFFLIKSLYNKYIKIQPNGGFLYYTGNHILSSGAVLGVFSLLFLFFCYYHNTLNPATLPIHTLTNGEKVINFQTMSHIATENFYNSVKINILNYKKAGFVLYYEGVKPGNLESMDKFNNILGIEFTKDLYENMSSIYGLKEQNTKDYLGLVNGNDINVDTSLDEIINLYEKKYGKINVNTLSGSIISNIGETTLKGLEKMNEEEKRTFRYINLAIMNFFVKNNNIQSFIVSIIGKNEAMDIILNERNKVIAEKILLSNDKQILLTYGALHFNGVFEILKKADNRWNIVSTQYIYPFK